MTGRIVKPPAKRISPLAWAAVPLAAAVAWIAWSRFAIDHAKPLPHALPGDRFELDTPGGRVSLYASAATAGRPLLLVHSVNAAASSYEVRPLYLHFMASRPVYALDLPGFGFSERADRIHTPRMMADAILAATADINARHGGDAVDLLALSLSCEYAARACLEAPERFATLGLISPTGFSRALAGNGTAQSTKGSRLRLGIVSNPLWSQALYDLVTTRPSMRFFLGKTWGSPRIDEGLLDYDDASAHQPGARYAVWSFLSGFLFANDISRLYRLLRLPVWFVHGTRGDFVDYRNKHEVTGKPNWTHEVFDTGAFPHFENLDAVVASYEEFLAHAPM